MNSELIEVDLTPEEVLHESGAHNQNVELKSRMPEFPSIELNTGFGLGKATDAPAIPSIQELRSLGVLWPAEVDRLCAEDERRQFLVDDFLPARSIAIAAGESTIGKSALICQLGLCVAAGVPFLGLPTTKGPVLYLDLENSLPSCKTMRDSLVGFLGLDGPPQDFLLKPEPSVDLEGLLEVVRPKLVAIDSLRAFRPDIAEKNSSAGEWLQLIRKLSRKHDCSFLIVHHLRKSSRNFPSPDLESCSAASWLQEMEGARALVNQTDVRMAIAEGDSETANLRVKWSRRVCGDSPLIQVERIFDDNGEPLGYRQLAGAGLLNSQKRLAFDRLREEFCTAEAKEARRVCGLGGGNDSTNKFLAECKHLRIVEKLERGLWKKIAAAPK